MKPKVEYLVQYWNKREWMTWGESKTLKTARKQREYARTQIEDCGGGNDTRIIRREITETVVEESKP